MNFCLHSIFTCSVTVWGVLVLPDKSQKQKRQTGKTLGPVTRRKSSEGMEWLGVWSCIFFGLWIFKFFGARTLAKIALSAEFLEFSWKFRPLEIIFRTLENGHSIRHQSIPPLSANRDTRKIQDLAYFGLSFLSSVCQVCETQSTQPY